MAGLLWSILILPSSQGSGPAEFVPDNPYPPPLQAQQNDLVSWNNQTHDRHQPVIDGTNTPLCEVLEPFTATRTAYEIQQAVGTTINYHCSQHSGETGAIVVVAG